MRIAIIAGITALSTQAILGLVGATLPGGSFRNACYGDWWSSHRCKLLGYEEHYNLQLLLQEYKVYIELEAAKMKE